MFTFEPPNFFPVAAAFHISNAEDFICLYILFTFFFCLPSRFEVIPHCDFDYWSE